MATSCGRFQRKSICTTTADPRLTLASSLTWVRSPSGATERFPGTRTRTRLSSYLQQWLEPSPSGLPTSDPSRSAKSPLSILWKHPAPQASLSSVVLIRAPLISTPRMMSSCPFRAVPQTQQGYTLPFASWPRNTRSWLRGQHRRYWQTPSSFSQKVLDSQDSDSRVTRSNGSLGFACQGQGFPLSVANWPSGHNKLWPQAASFERWQGELPAFVPPPPFSMGIKVKSCPGEAHKF